MATTADRTTPRRNGTPAAASHADDVMPSHDLDAERGVLGSILMLPDVFDEVALRLDADDFFDDAHQTLYGVFCELRDKQKPIDMTVLVDLLKRTGRFELVGGTKYVSQVFNSVPHASHAVYYADIVRDMAIRRRLLIASMKTAKAAKDAETADDALAEAEAQLGAVSDRAVRQADVKPISDVFRSVMQALQENRASRDEGLPTGFSALDRKLGGGLRRKELVIVAGRPSMGKTALACNIVANVARSENNHVFFVSLEMGSLQIADRFLAAEARVSGYRLVRNELTQEERMNCIACADNISHWALSVDDTPTMKVQQIAAKARRQKRKTGLSLVVIDYLQLIEPDNPRDPRQEQVSKMSRRLKVMARELDVPVICLAQLNRQVESTNDNRPKLSHLRESGAIEQDADIVIFTHRPAYYAAKKSGEHETSAVSESDAELIVGKQRNGEVGVAPVIWFKEFMRFDNIADPRQEKSKHEAFEAWNYNSFN